MLTESQQLAREVRDLIYSETKCVGAIKWHNNRSSYYIKFRDTRIGSLRISSHEGRERYSYKWTILTNKSTEEVINEAMVTIAEIIARSNEIKNFDPKKYIVWDKWHRYYFLLKNRKEYNDFVLNGRLTLASQEKPLKKKRGGARYTEEGLLKTIRKPSLDPAVRLAISMPASLSMRIKDHCKRNSVKVSKFMAGLAAEFFDKNK